MERSERIHESRAKRLTEELPERLESILRAGRVLDPTWTDADLSAAEDVPILGAVRAAVAALVGLALEGDIEDERLAAVVNATADIAFLPEEPLRLELSRLALGDYRLIAYPPRPALQAQARLVRAAASLQEVSVWRRGDGGDECLACVGASEPSPVVRRDALRALAGDATVDARVHAVPIKRWQELQAVLVARAERGNVDDLCRSVMDTAAAAMQVSLEKDSLLRRNAERERSLLQATERRFTRFGLDLHDGPIQDLAVLADEVRLFRRQISSALEDFAQRDLLVGRIDDLEAMLLALDGDLRELAHSFESPSFLSRPFRDVLEREVASFRRRADIEAALRVQGDLSGLTASQRIALLRILQEALANIREHSDASAVEISVRKGEAAIEASIRDNGRGFDVEPTLVKAAARGRLGLVGMSERVRLLAGAFDIESSPGGPTTVSVTLPAWKPLSRAEGRDARGA